MNKLTAIAFVVAATACVSSPSGDRATLGNLEFVVPSGWSSKDLSTADRPMSEWSPRADDNERKESIVVFRTDRAAFAKSGSVIARFLEEAQRSLPAAKFNKPTRRSTTTGFTSFEIEGDFTPSSQTATYHRVHAVLVDGTALLHIVYTGRRADREAFELVVDSVHTNHGA